MNLRVAGAFKRLYFGKRTGVLTCESRNARRAVFFRSGFVVGARSSLDEDRLGEVMMRHGRITQQQFEDASNFIKSGWKLGEILAELKVIEAGEIQEFVRLQLLDIACMQLISPPKRLAFSKLSGVDAVIEAPLSVADILMEAARRTEKLSPHTKALMEDSRKLGFPGDPLKRFQDINLKPEEAFVLSRIDGTQTAGDIFAISPLSEEDTARTLLGLLQAEVIEPEGQGDPEPVDESAEAQQDDSSLYQDSPREPTQARKSTEKQPTSPASSPASEQSELERERVRSEIARTYQEFQFKDHWQVLEVDPGSPSEAVKQAFFRQARKYHPDAYRRITDPDFHEQLSYVFQRVHEAYETLISDSARARYEELATKEQHYERIQKDWRERSAVSKAQSDNGTQASAGRRQDSVEGKAFYMKAKQAFDETDYWNAIEHARLAIEASPETAAYYHLLGLALSKNPKWRQDAEKNLRIATNLDPWNVSYLISLGKLYEEAGLNLRAQKTFEQAKAVDPSARVPGD